MRFMRHPVVRSLGIAPGLLVVAGFSPPAQERPKRPIFTSGAELVVVDFVVTDKTDRPVRGLSAKDFVVREDGKARPIVAFEAFAGTDPPAQAIRSVAPEPRVSPGPQSPGPSTVVLVDDGHLSVTQAASVRPALMVLLSKLGEHGGRLMLVAPGSKVSVAGLLPAGAVNFGAAVDRIVGQRVEDHSPHPVADAEAIAIVRGDGAALTRVAGRIGALNPELGDRMARMVAQSRATEVAHDARVRREGTYGVALLCLDWLADQPGRHSLVVVSGGIAAEPGDQTYSELVTRSLRANAPIHFLDARGLRGIGRYQGVEYGPGLDPENDEGPFGWSEAAGGSRHLADDTGGISVANANDMEKGLRRLLDTMTTYYVLAYEPPVHDKPGFRKIKVEVRVKGLRVRARRGYLSVPPAPR